MRTMLLQYLPLAILIVASVGGCAPATTRVSRVDTDGLVVPHVDVPRAMTPPRMDGSADDPAWRDAANVGTLVAPLGKSDTTSSLLPTHVLLLWDSDALYVRFVAQDPSVYLPFDGDQRDREYYRGDVAEVFLDVVGDGKHVYELQVTPANQVFDQLLLVTADRVEYNSNGRIVQSILDRDWWKNPSYDMPGLRTAAARTDDKSGWIVDIAIPATAAMKRVGVKTFDAGRTLRANFMRYDWEAAPQSTDHEKRLLVPQNWSPVEFGRPHQSPGAMGTLHLMDR